MQKIASFTVNHNKLKKGIYISRIDSDIITYDIRMKVPNKGDYLSSPVMHTIEHLFATYARNSNFSNSVIYVGPMGCRTGFYLLLKDDVKKNDVIKLVISTFEFIRDFSGKIPGSSKIECGNYKEHDLDGAKKVSVDMLDVLKNWNEEKMKYE